MHLGAERTAAFIRHALDAGSYVVCHETLTYGDFPDYGPAICRGFFDAYRNAAKAGSNRENRPARQQAETLPALGPLLESSRTPEPKPPNHCRPSRPWHTCDQGRHGIVGITGGSP
jgi:hypothetical protein